MAYRKISCDVKFAALRLYQCRLLPLRMILDCIGISKRTFHRIMHLWRRTGDVVQHSFGNRGRPRLFRYSDIEYMKQIIGHRPDLFLDELERLLHTNRLVSASFSTILRGLCRAGISYKKIKKIASERNDTLRSDFIRRMAQYQPEQLGFLDEMSKDERTSFRSYGRSTKGIRAVKKGVFVHGRCFSVEGLLSIDGMISNTVVEGSMTKARFMQYLEHSVVRYILTILQLWLKMV